MSAPTNLTEYRSQRDTLVPDVVYVTFSPQPGLTDGAQIPLARLTMKRTLRLSKLFDRIGDRAEVLEAFSEITKSFMSSEIQLPEEAAEMTQAELEAYVEEQMGTTAQDMDIFDLVLGINAVIASLDPDDVLEFYSILLDADPEFIDQYWDIDVGIETVRLAFQQPAFQKLLNRFGIGGNRETTSEKDSEAEGTQEPGNSTHMEENFTPSST